MLKGRNVVEVGRSYSNCSECGHNYLGGRVCEACGTKFVGAILVYVGLPYDSDEFMGLPLLPSPWE